MLAGVKVEPGLNTIHELSDDSDGDVEFIKSESKIQASLSLQVVCKETTPHVHLSCNHGQCKVVTNHVVNMIHSLMCLGACKRSKSVLSHINFDAIRLQQVDCRAPLQRDTRNTMGTKGTPE